MDRRSFLKEAAVASGAFALMDGRPTQAAPAGRKSRIRTKTPFVGVQIASHSFFDEGIDHCLDLLQESGGVNVLLISSHSYYGAMGRPRHLMADHGVPIRDNAKRKLPRVWLKHHDKYYRDTTLRHKKPDPDAEHAGREVFAELAEPARKRGMLLYERMYEPSSSAKRFVENFETILSIDVYGQRRRRPCMNNPNYRAWLFGTLRDMFENYPVDGIQYGAERCGPMSDLVFWDDVPGCFCEHCTKLGRERGIDVARAKEGFTEFHKYFVSLQKGEANPTDGAFIGLIRIVMEYPELLAWEQQWCDTAMDLHSKVREVVRSVNPNAEVGRHVDHRQSTWDVLFRAGSSYNEMADGCDFIKPILYHDIAGPRVFKNLERTNGTILRQLSLKQQLGLYYALFNHDPTKEPTLEELPTEGLSPEYVYTETKRAVDGAAGKARVYSGIGLDIPSGKGWGTDKWQSDPEEVYTAVASAFQAGGAGVVASREYEEITVSSLKAMKRAVQDAAKAKG